MKVKVIGSGYQVEVISWENDGDNYRTQSVNFATLDEAVAAKDFLVTMLGKCGTLGNACEDEVSQSVYKILTYLSSSKYAEVLFPETVSKLTQKVADELEEASDWAKCKSLICELSLSDEEEDNIVMTVRGFVRSFTGYSEYYLFRVVEAVRIIYHNDDVFAEELL